MTIPISKAIHEAAHQCVAHALGCRISGAIIGSPTSRAYHVDRYDPNTNSAIGWAGALATQYAGYKGEQPSDADCRLIHEALDKTATRKTALTIIIKRWDRLIALAARLEEAGEVGGDEATSILEG